MLCNLDTFILEIKLKTRIIGIDFGSKNIGIAISDKDQNLATPKIVIKRNTNIKTIESIKNIIDENNVSGIVFGLPLNSKGEETKFCQSIRNFCNVFCETCNLPILLHNEFLTSSSAEYTLKEDILKDYNYIKNNIDKISATIILQEVLDLIKKKI